jgi:hypothetical protein
VLGVEQLVQKILLAVLLQMVAVLLVEQLLETVVREL